MIEKARNDRTVFDLRTRNDQTARIAARKALDDSVTVALDDEAREKVLDLIAAGEPGEDPVKRRYYPRREDWNYAWDIFAMIPSCHSRGGSASDLEQRRPGDLRFPIGRHRALCRPRGGLRPGPPSAEVAGRPIPGDHLLQPVFPGLPDRLVVRICQKCRITFSHRYEATGWHPLIRGSKEVNGSQERGLQA